VVECRLPVLCFELAGEHFVVLTENDYHELAGRNSPATDLRTGLPRLVQKRQMPRDLWARQRQPVLRRSSTQRAGERSKISMSRNPPRPSRPLPGSRPMSGLRTRERREVGRLGRVQRKGTTQDQTGTAS
jgi:hypothetical protein